MTNWIPDLSSHSGPVYLGIAEAIAVAVRAGRLRTGDALPPQRLLADLLGVNLSTVTRGYREAERRGFIEGNTRRGTVVRARDDIVGLFEMHAGQAPAIDLSINMPARDPRDRSIERVLDELREEGRIGALMTYQGASEWERWREQAGKWMATNGVPVEPERIVLCAGAQHALGTALAAAVDRPDVGVERYTYPGVKAIAQARAYRLHALDMDDEGVTPAALQQAARKGLRVVILSSSLQNPTGAVMSLQRRKELARIAIARGLMLIEEDVYGALLPDRLAPIAAFAPDHVYYVTGLSKTVLPGLRLGMLAVPAPHAARFADAVHSTSWFLSPLNVELACRLIASGEAFKRVQWQQRELLQRNAMFDTALGIAPTASGAPHRWLALTGRTDAASAVRRLAEAGVRVVAGSDFAVGAASGGAHVRVSVGAAASRRELQQAARIMAGTRLLSLS